MRVDDAIANDLSLWKAKAECAERELGQIAEGFFAAGPTHAHHIHYLFAAVYQCTTRRWLARLSKRNDSGYAYRVICRFFEIYKDQVFERLDTPLRSIEPHWQRYHRKARRQTILSPISAHLILISVGVRAHVYGDLGRAMHWAEQGLGHQIELETKEPAARDNIFGAISDKAFYDAALDYVALQHARHAGWRRFVLRLDRLGLQVLKPIWIPVLQRWRRTGYAAAVARAHSLRISDSQ